MRPFNIFRLSPLSSGEPATAIQQVLAAAPWALLAVLFLALLNR